MQAMGLSGISKSTVSKLCKDIDERVMAFLDRPLEGDCVNRPSNGTLYRRPKVTPYKLLLVPVVHRGDPRGAECLFRG